MASLHGFAANPVVVDTKLLSIDSRDRENASTTSQNSYRVRFDGVEQVIAMQLISSSIPNTEYSVNSTNNKVDFYNGSTTYNITLTAGTYTAADLADELNTQMNTAVGTGFGVTYTVSYDSTTKKFTVSNVLPGSHQFLFATGANAANSAAQPLGFSAADTTLAATTTSDQQVNLLGEPFVYMRLIGIGNLLTSSSTSEAFAKIEFSVPPANVAYNQHVAEVRRFSPPLPSLDHLDVRFEKLDGTLYDFNEFDHSYTIRLWYLTGPREPVGVTIVGSTIGTPGVGRGIDEGVYS